MHPHYASMLAHLIAMARLPGWKAYAWERAKELAQDRALYPDIDKALTAAMKERANASE
jgi:hypothetical protein